MDDVVRHHLDPIGALQTYDTVDAILPPMSSADIGDFTVMRNPTLVSAIAVANERSSWPASEEEIAAILSFLDALTDPTVFDPEEDVPDKVPSGLPVDD